MDMKRALKGVVVGGSIAGLGCAHALISAGWEVKVIEKSQSPPSGSPTGTGLGLDPQAQEILRRWIPDHVLRDATVPLSIDMNRATDSKKKSCRTLTRDEHFNFRAAHWADLHSIVHAVLPPGVVLWGHQFISFNVSYGKSYVEVNARGLGTGETVVIAGELLVAAERVPVHHPRPFPSRIQTKVVNAHKYSKAFPIRKH